MYPWVHRLLLESCSNSPIGYELGTTENKQNVNYSILKGTMCLKMTLK